MKLLKWLTILVALSVVLDGCSSRGSVDENADAANAAGKAGARGKTGKYGRDGGADGSTFGGDGATGGLNGSGDLDDPSGPLAKRVIYFQYDSYEVLPEYEDVISAHAGYLAAHPQQRATLEGHADERGSPEYNVALGEQRAKAVQRMLQIQGGGKGQVQVLSFGEEKPVVDGHGESSWQQNRRVEITYPGH